VNPCDFCGQSNSTEARFCVDCGKPLGGALRPVLAEARSGGTRVPATRVGMEGPTGPLNRSSKQTNVAKQTMIFSARRRIAAWRLVVLDETGEPKESVDIDRQAMSIGRVDCDIVFPNDDYLSPRHAELSVRDSAVYVRDLGSANRTWLFIEQPQPLEDGEVLLIGSQLLQFRRSETHGDGGRAEDGTRRIGSLAPEPDAAQLAQLRADGTVRDIFHLAAKGATVIGRDTGDWLFPYDQTMSGRHAELRAEDGAFVIEDLGSRNGIAVAVHGERLLRAGARILVGDQVFRVEQV